MNVRQYYPAFVEGFSAWEGSVSTYAEFLAIPFIHRLFEVEDFRQLEARVYTEDTLVVKAVLDSHSYVIAFCTGEDRLRVLAPLLET
jgi:hypothetical protein